MQVEVFVYSTPMRVRFRGLTERNGLLLHGAAGWAEVSPFWDYDVVESSRWLRAGWEAATEGYPEPQRTQIPVNVTIPAVGAEQAFQLATRGGCHTAKVKIAEPGQTLADDLARLEAVRAALPDAKLRVDVNAKWDYAQALAAIPQLDQAAGGLEYVEQPCPQVADLARLRRKLDVPIAADESIRRAADPLEVRRQEAADVVILKNQPLGGVRRALDLADALGIPAVVSSALESSVGIRAGVAFAAALPELNHACGLGTVQLFDRDPAQESLLPVDGMLPVRDVEPELSAAVAPGEVRARWEKRFADMWEYLRERGALPANATYVMR